MNELKEFNKGMKDGEKVLKRLSDDKTIGALLGLIITGASSLTTPEGRAIVSDFFKATRKISSGYRKAIKKIVKTYVKMGPSFESIAERLSKHFENSQPTKESMENFTTKFSDLDI